MEIPNEFFSPTIQVGGKDSLGCTKHNKDILISVARNPVVADEILDLYFTNIEADRFLRKLENAL